MSTLTAINIHHIRQNIADYLGPSDLSRCVRVNKAWHTAFTPSLYRLMYICRPRCVASATPSLGNQQTQDFPITPHSSLALGLQRYGHHVRAVHVLELPSLEVAVLAKYCHFLQKIFLPLPILRGFDVQALMQLSTSSSAIEYLYLSIGDELQSGLTTIVPLLSNLKTARLLFHTQQTPNLFPLILWSCPHLEKLEIYANLIDWQVPTPRTFPMAPQLRKFEDDLLQSDHIYPRLQTLIIRACWTQHADPYAFFAFVLTKCPNISTLCMPYCGSGRNAGTAALCTALQLMPKRGTRSLQSLHMIGNSDATTADNLGEDNQEELYQILGTLPTHTLIHFRLEQQRSIGSRLLEKLSHCHGFSLRELELPHVRWCDQRHQQSSAMILNVLTSCPNLKTLDISSMVPEGRRREKGRVEGAVLFGQDAISKPWVCSGIERLRLTIVGICRPSAYRCQLKQLQPAQEILTTTNGSGSKESKSKHICHSLQEALFLQLGRLHAIKEINLGPNSPDFPGAQSVDCLEWSLHHGFLQHMKECRQLESLTISPNYHGITVSDLQWMQEHWPRLRKLTLRGKSLRAWIHENWRGLSS